MKPRMKKLLLIIPLLLACFAARAQKGYNLVSPSLDPAGDSLVFEQMRERMAAVRTSCGRPTVAVVLSGGGAKGAAHVGVLRRLEEKGIPVDMILGTSMGGLVGGLYSLGYRAEFLDSLLRSFDWKLMLSDNIDPSFIPYSDKMLREKFNLLVPIGYGKSRKLRHYPDVTRPQDASQRGLGASLPAGWVSGINVENALSRLTVGYRDSISFMDLPIPFFCVSSDLVSGKSKNWTGGDVALAMRSTMSIPGLFNPVRYKGMVLADGGMRNNFPTDLARAMGADIIIGVVLSQVDESNIRVNNIGDIISQMIDMLSREAYDKGIAEADVCIRPDLKGYDMMSFSTEAIDTILRRGYAAALEHDSELDMVASGTAGHPVLPMKESATDISSAMVKISSVEFPGKNWKDSQLLQEKVKINPGDRVGSAQIEDAVSAIFGTGSFRDVSYSLLADEGAYRLQFNLTDGPVHRVGIAGRADTEDMMAGLLSFSYNAYRLSGSKLDLEARIGQNWYGMAKWSLTSPHLPALGVGLRSGKNMANMIIDGAFCDAGYWHHRADVSLSGFHSASFDIAAGARLDYYGLNSWLSEKSFDDQISTIGSLATYRRAFVTAYGNARAYTLDNKYFPTRGFTLGIGYEGVIAENFSQILSIDYLEHFRICDWLSVLPSLNLRFVVSDEATLENNLFIANFAGGAIAGRYLDQQMPFAGFHRCTLLEDFAYDAQLDIRANIFKNAFVSLKGGIIQSASEITELFGDSSSSIYGGALEFAYASFLGPIKFDLQYSTLNGIGAYVSLGYDF